MASFAIDGTGTPSPKNKTLLVHIIDHMAKTKPQALYAEYPISPVTYDEGFRKVTYQAFANAINGVAWYLHENLGAGKELDTLAYIGLNNFIYPPLILGAAKAGYKVGKTNGRIEFITNLVVFLGSPSITTKQCRRPAWAHSSYKMQDTYYFWSSFTSCGCNPEYRRSWSPRIGNPNH
jgi:hypothetical protein